jgi:hypothetical protein
MTSSRFGPLVPVLSNRPLYRDYPQEAIIAASDTLVRLHNIETVVIATATRALFRLKSESTIEELPSNPNFNVAFDGLGKMVAKLVGAGKHVVLLVDNPTLPEPKDCFRRVTSSDFLNKVLGRSEPVEKPGSCVISLDRHLELSAQYRRLLRSIADAHPGKVEVFDATEKLCVPADGICTYRRDGLLLYSYTDHVSTFASRLIGVELNARLAQDRQRKAQSVEAVDSVASR